MGYLWMKRHIAALIGITRAPPTLALVSFVYSCTLHRVIGPSHNIDRWDQVSLCQYSHLALKLG